MNDLSKVRKLIKDCIETQNPRFDLSKCRINYLLFKNYYYVRIFFSYRFY